MRDTHTHQTIHLADRGMVMRQHNEIELDKRTRLALFYQTTIDMHTALTLQNQDITFQMMVRSGVRVSNCALANVNLHFLYERGAKSAHDLRLLGYDAYYLCESKHCNEAILLYGAEDVVRAFVNTATDAVIIADRDAVQLLGMTTDRLLQLCAGCPGEAVEVLRWLPPGTALSGVSSKVLLDSGLRAPALTRLGYGLAAVIAHVNPTTEELNKLGYGFYM